MVQECRRMRNLSMTVLPEIFILKNNEMLKIKNNSGINCSTELTHMHHCCFCNLQPSAEMSPRTGRPENLNCKRIIHTNGEHG